MSKTVMVIDDSAAVRVQAVKALMDAGFTVVEAVDGLEAIGILEGGGEVALIVCDVNMPRMDGIEFVEALAQRVVRPPVLMLTTEGHPEVIKRARASGARGMDGETLQAGGPRLGRAQACRVDQRSSAGGSTAPSIHVRLRWS